MTLAGLTHPGPPINVLLIAEDAELARTTPEWISGFAEGSRSLVVLFPDRARGYPLDSLETLLHHEVAHVLFWRAARGRPVPRWFNEGLALADERPIGLGDRTRLAWTLIRYGRLDLRRLERLFGEGRAANQRAYAVSGALVRELLRSYGQASAGRVLALVGAGASFEEAFQRATGWQPAVNAREGIERLHVRIGENREGVRITASAGVASYPEHAESADGLITVCAALKEELVRLGIPPERVRTLRNGVDLEIFKPLHPQQAKDALAVGGPVLASVGSLIERKGHDLVIRALQHLPEVTLLIAGEGPEKAALARLAAAIGVENRVRFLGGVPHERLSGIYSAADALVLASSREGWPNVLLESMACGTPVIASNVWGAPEIIKAPEAGVLLHERTAGAIASAARALLAAPPPREATRAYAQRFSWQETTEGQVDLFSRILRPASAVMPVSRAFP